MTCYTEFDELQEALSRVRLDENVMPYRNGMLVENEDEYNKIQKLLACEKMQDAHRWLYDLDYENLSEADIGKIDRLFDMGVSKGYIDNSFEEELAKEENPDAFVPAEEPAPAVAQQPVNKVPVPCWTVLYSATKDGETKCGEAFSNAINVTAAKADALAKLARFGYENVSVLAIEAGDPDMAGCEKTAVAVFEKKVAEKTDCELNEDKAEYVVQKQKGGAGEWEDVEKFDNLSKARMCLDKKRAEAESKDCGCKFQITRDGKVEVGPDDDTFGPSQVDESASKNPYAAGMKTVTGGKSGGNGGFGKGCGFGSAPKKAKAVKEADDEEASADEEPAKEDKKEGKPAEEPVAEEPEVEKTEDAQAEEVSAEDTAAEEKPEEKPAEEASEEKPAEDASEETSDTAEDASAEEPAEEKSEEPAEEEPAEEKAELDDAAKSELKDEYRRVFKATMLKCKFEDKSFNDLTIEEKVTFFEALAKAWTKNQPSEFMSDKENDQLEEIVVKP